MSGEMKSQLSGVKTIGNDIDDHYPTIKDAVGDLNSKGINASVVFEIDSPTDAFDDLMHKLNLPTRGGSFRP